MGTAAAVSRRLLIGLTIIVIIAVSAVIGVLVASGPDWIGVLRAPH